MVNFVPPPVVQELIPPFLAHLPTAFTSPQPPPSLFPLLSPILRQRIRLLSSSSSTPSPGDTWLSLLTWSSSSASNIVSQLSNWEFNPHPASGEPEAGETIFKGIQRVDREMLKAAVELIELDIVIIFTWIANDPDGEDDGWRIMDIKLVSELDVSPDQKWYPTVGEADTAFYNGDSELSVMETLVRKASLGGPPPINEPEQSHDDGDDDYWNMYDRTPARTPAVPQQPDQPSEDAYFARYNNIQPSLEPEPELPQSQPQHNIPNPLPIIPSANPTYSPTISAGTTASTPPTALSASSPITAHAPRAISSRSSDASNKERIRRMEETVSLQVQSEVAVKQHVATTIKSLYRLSKNAGIGKEEFQRMVQTEMSVLEMMDEAEDGIGSEGW
ncbi:hypothetical protein RUND412_009340 [Rhizina undulata]